MHTLIVIGFLGGKICFLDMTKEEAIQKYEEIEGTTDRRDVRIDEFKFRQFFGAYDAYSWEDEIAL